MAVRWKLVRDKIPHIIKESGRDCEYKVLDSEEYMKALIKKLDEEVKELKDELRKDNGDVQGEMADVLEVLAAIRAHKDIDTEKLFEHAEQKRKERGGFLGAIYMKIMK